MPRLTGRAPGWHLHPGRAEWRLALRWAAFLTLLFGVVYGGSNWLAARQGTRLRLWFDWELAIPLVPGMVWIYLSLLVTFFLPVFALRGPAIDTLCRRLAAAVLLSGAAFVLWPAEAGFARPATPPNTAFALLYQLDLPHNLAPSLHISWSALILGSLRAPAPAWLRRLLEAWFALICAAVLLVHQHHVIDILGGLVVALLATALINNERKWPWQRAS